MDVVKGEARQWAASLGVGVKFVYIELEGIDARESWRRAPSADSIQALVWMLGEVHEMFGRGEGCAASVCLSIWLSGSRTGGFF